MRHFYTLIFLILLTNQLIFAQLPTLIATIEGDSSQTIFGIEIAPLGDQNNDGYSDFAVMDITSKMIIYYGGPNGTYTTSYPFHDIRSPLSLVGDLNDDFLDDWVIHTIPPKPNKSHVFFGGFPFDTLHSFQFGLDTLIGIGDIVRGYDINQNGTDELIVSGHLGRSVLFYELDSINDTLPDLILKASNNPITWQFGAGTLAGGDYNADGFTDLAVRVTTRAADSSNGKVYIYNGGPLFDTIPDMIINRPGSYQTSYEFSSFFLRTIDINGDTIDDLFVAPRPSSDDTNSFFYYGGPDFDTIPDLILAYSDAFAIQSAKNAGDINKDGYEDLIVSSPSPYDALGAVTIYFGGPDVDSLPDIRIKNADLIGYQKYFGKDCAGIGDFNGDGVDDFAFSFISSLDVGWVYVYSGTGIPTDVDYDDEPNLPTDFILSQNYPNPFNGGTIITLSLPSHGKYTFEIINILGQNMYKEVLDINSPGEHVIDLSTNIFDNWSSGIYFYRLIGEENNMSKKMIYLK